MDTYGVPAKEAARALSIQYMPKAPLHPILLAGPVWEGSNVQLALTSKKLNPNSQPIFVEKDPITAHNRRKDLAKRFPKSNFYTGSLFSLKMVKHSDYFGLDTCNELNGDFLNWMDEALSFLNVNGILDLTICGTRRFCHLTRFLDEDASRLLSTYPIPRSFTQQINVQGDLGGNWDSLDTRFKVRILALYHFLQMKGDYEFQAAYAYHGKQDQASNGPPRPMLKVIFKKTGPLSPIVNTTAEKFCKELKSYTHNVSQTPIIQEENTVISQRKAIFQAIQEMAGTTAEKLDLSRRNELRTKAAEIYGGTIQQSNFNTLLTQVRANELRHPANAALVKRPLSSNFTAAPGPFGQQLAEIKRIFGQADASRIVNAMLAMV